MLSGLEHLIILLNVQVPIIFFFSAIQKCVGRLECTVSVRNQRRTYYY